MATETQTQAKVPAVITQFRTELSRMEDQFRAVLPPQISPERFSRVVLTAIQREPRLLACDRQSLWNSALQCATDGLLPDGREAVLLPFSSEDEEKVRSGSKVSYLPMIFGIRQKVRRSGALSNWQVQVVQEGDLFDYELGDSPFIKHKPSLKGGRTRPVIAAYSIATFPDGSQTFEIMNADQIEDIRKKSRAKKGPWSDPVSYPEMARKSVARLHSKQLPMSSDLEAIFRRHDEAFGLNQSDDRAAPASQRPALGRGGVAAALEHFGSGSTGEGEPPGSTQTPKAEGGTGPEADERSGEGGPGGGESGGGETTSQGGGSDLFQGQGAPPQPTDAASYKDYAKRVIDSTTAGSASRLEPWLVSDQQRDLRQRCKVTKADYDEVRGWVQGALDKLKKPGG